MNSIYGNTIAPGGIGDLYFYDRTYSRNDFATDSMRQAKAQSDGVFLGRYVLVESIGENDGHNEAWRKVMKSAWQYSMPQLLKLVLAMRKIMVQNILIHLMYLMVILLEVLNTRSHQARVAMMPMVNIVFH